MSSTAATIAHYTVPEAPPPSPVERPARARRSADWRIVLASVFVVSAVYVFWHLGRGWVPHDEGALGQSAERLLQGELPHRDFDEIYTGGLSYLNAAAFRLLGTTLWSLRVMLFAVFLGWIPAVYYIASRFAKPLVAGGVTLLAVAWSLPNYTAPLPSWYNLFLATFGLAALFRHIETRHRGWLVVAGIAGGLSVLAKVVGLYYVAGVLLYQVFQAHALSRTRIRTVPAPGERRGVVYAAFVSAALLLFVATLAALVRHRLHAPEVVQFVLPGALIAALLVRNEWTLPAGDSRSRFLTLAGLVIPFLAGFALPIALFLLPYLRADAVGALVYGVFVLPTKRFGFAATRALPLTTMLAVIPLVGLAVLAWRRPVPGRRWDLVALAAAVPLFIFATGSSDALYRVVWYAVRNLLPVLAILGVWLLSRDREADAGEPQLRQRAVLLLSVTSLCYLVQFPFVVPIYFCYAAPLVGLTVVALMRYFPPSSPRIAAAALAFFTLFPVFRINGSPLATMGRYYAPYVPTAPLTMRRGGLDVPEFHVAQYDVLIRMLRQRSRGEYTYASPDAPEIYFLSGLRNPTRTMFEFFDDSNKTTARVLDALETHGVTAVVMNSTAPFSPRMSDELIGALEQRYPYAVDIANFQLRWRQ